MQLLSSEEIKATEDVKEKEGQERIRKMRDAETASAKALSNLQGSYASEKKRLENELQEFKVETSEKIAELVRTVGGLEQRKAEALKPIDSKLIEISEREKQIKEDLVTIDRRKMELEDFANSITAIDGLVTQKQTELDKLERGLLERALTIGDKEIRIQEIAQILERAQKDFEKVSAAHIRDIERREKEIKDKETSISIVMEQVNDERTRLDRERTALKDGYATLERAKKEIYGNRQT